MIDETGKRVWEETFDLWGKPHDHLETRVVGGAILTNVKPREANKNQAISQPFRFPGQYHDEETGLYYNRYRYYMPNEGMYTQRDPIGLAGGNPTTYGYVFNTLKHTDPFGLIALNAPGFSVYGLFLAGSNEPYYIGFTNDTIERAKQHGRSGRMPDGSKMEVLDDNLTFGKARGFEQARIEHHGTLKGVWGKPISEKNLGNKNNSFDIKRTDERAKHFNKHRKDKLRQLGAGCR